MYNQWIKNNIYKLKQTSGKKIIIQSKSNTQYNLETGKRVVNYFWLEVPKAIVLEERFERVFDPVDGRFRLGGYQENKIRNILIDRNDLPKDFVITLEQWIIFNNKRYDIIKVEDYDDKNVYNLIVKHVRDQQINFVESSNINDVLPILETIDAVIEP